MPIDEWNASEGKRRFTHTYVFTFRSVKITQATEKLEEWLTNHTQHLESAVNILHLYHTFNQLAVHQPVFLTVLFKLFQGTADVSSFQTLQHVFH